MRRLFPRGPVDLVWQLLLLGLAYYGWRYARGAVDGGVAESFAHARDLISIERGLGTLIEADVQRWAIDAGWPSDFARWMYANAHFKGSCLALLFIYFFHQGSFRFVRNAVIAAMAISLAGYALYPTAPPRFLPEMGLETSRAVTGNSPVMLNPGDPLFNGFAAVPSMHVGLSMIFGWSLGLLVRPWPLRALFFSYPLIVTYVTVATANHFWLDALFGAWTATAAAGVAYLLAQVGPASWAWRSPVGAPGSRAVEPEPEAAPA